MKKEIKKDIEIILTSERNLDDAKIKYDQMVDRIRNVLKNQETDEDNEKLINKRLKTIKELDSDYLWLLVENRNKKSIMELLEDKYDTYLDRIVDYIAYVLDYNIINPNDNIFIKTLSKFLILVTFIDLEDLIVNILSMKDEIVKRMQNENITKLRVFIPTVNLKLIGLQSSFRDLYHNNILNPIISYLLRSDEIDANIFTIALNTNMYQTHEYLSRLEFIKFVSNEINKNEFYNDILNRIFEETDINEVIEDIMYQALEDKESASDLDLSKAKLTSILIEQDTKYTQ